MNQRTEKFTLKAIQSYHHSSLICFDDQETLVEALANRIGFSGANPIAFLSILARRPEFRLSDLDEAILTDKTLVRANSFRGSLFLMASIDYPIYFRALNQLLRSSSLERLLEAGISELDLLRAQHRLEAADIKIPQSHEQLIEIIYRRKTPAPSPNAQRLMIRKLCEQGTLVRTFHKGWKGNNFLYALTRNWFPDFKLGSENQETARCHLIKRYVATYGPVSKKDMIWWSGLTEAQIERTFSNIRREITSVTAEGIKDDLYILKERIPALKQAGNKDHQVAFLPPFDPYTNGWICRKRNIKRSYYNYVYDPLGNAAGTIIYNGKIIGVWQFRDGQDHIFEYHLFNAYSDLASDIQFLAEQYAQSLSRISGSNKTYIYKRDLPETLDKRPPASFLWPLGKEPPFKTADPEMLTSPLERRTSNTFRKPYLSGSEGAVA
ncbi:MAG: AlkZ family DNA glycosylase [Deltaproteobacteria bacterium]|nr:AlkZ family DNA glycosylase [Deltaproteobacteria bacterium]